MFKKVKTNIIKQYLSTQRKESFVRFIKSMPRFKNEKRENILEKFNYIRSLVLQVIEQVPVQSINDGVHSKKIYDNLGKAYKIIRNEDLYSSEYLFDVMCSYQIQEQQEDFKF